MSESSDQMIAAKRRVVHLLAVNAVSTAVAASPSLHRSLSVCALCDCARVDRQTHGKRLLEKERQAGPGEEGDGLEGTEREAERRERERERRNSHQIFIVDAREGNL